MQNCLRELNLIYCLIYLDDIVVFLWTAEEHLHHLCIVFDRFRNHNLKLKLSKCIFSGKKSPIGHIESQRMGVTQQLKLESNQSACHLKLTLRCMPFMVWWATTGGSSRGLHALHSHSVNIWLEKGPAGSQSGCNLQKMP